MNHRIACIGCGYWGKNLVRNYHELGALAAVCERRASATLLSCLVIPFGMNVALSWETGLDQSKHYVLSLVPGMRVLGCALERLRVRKPPVLPVYVCLLGSLISISLALLRARPGGER